MALPPGFGERRSGRAPGTDIRRQGAPRCAWRNDHAGTDLQQLRADCVTLSTSKMLNLWNAKLPVVTLTYAADTGSAVDKRG